MTRLAVFLDRDGTLNKALVREGRPYPPGSVDELELMEGVSVWLPHIKSAGYLLLMVTNQPDVARGKVTRKDVQQINDHLSKLLGLDDVFVCWCIEGVDCPCYKPKPGLLIEAAKRYNIDLGKSYMVGDRWRDVAAGKAAGCTTIWLKSDYAEMEPELPDHIVANWEEASAVILRGAV